MTTITEGIAATLCALSKEEKGKVISLILQDDDFKMVISNMIIEGLAEKSMVRKREAKGDFPSSKRELAKALRKRYVSKLIELGIHINHDNNIWAKISSGLWVAMPFANERQQNRWFLGLGEIDLLKKNEEGKVVIIFLCKTREEQVIDFVVPPDVVEGILPYLSRSKGQFKFNIRKVGNIYKLLLPDRDSLDITKYISSTSCLQN